MKIKAWIEAMRLRTLPVSIAGVLTAVGYNLLYKNLNIKPVLLCMAFALLCQISSNFANEYFDYKAGRDKAGREGPRRGVTEGDISPRQMMIAIVMTTVVACAIGLCLVGYGGWWLVAIGVAVVLGLLAYSTGPYPLSTHGWGEVAVIVFFGVVPVTMTYYVETLQWSWDVMAGGIAVGLMGANVLIINNYRDIPDDREVGKMTLAVRWGGRAMKWLYMINVVVAIALMMPAWLSMRWFDLVTPLLTVYIAARIVYMMGKLKGRQLTPLLGMTAVLMFLYALMFMLSALCN